MHSSGDNPLPPPPALPPSIGIQAFPDWFNVDWLTTSAGKGLTPLKSATLEPTPPPAEKVPTDQRSRHNESQRRGRARLQQRFKELQTLVGASQTDQSSVLQITIDKLNEMEARIRELEFEQQQLLEQQLAVTPQPPSRPLSLETGITATLLQNFACAFISLNGFFIDANTRLLDILGLDRKTLLTKSMFTLTHPEDLHSTYSMVQKVMTKQAASWCLNKRCCHGDGGTVTVHVIFTLVEKIESGQIVPSHFAAFVFKADDFLTPEGWANPTKAETPAPAISSTMATNSSDQSSMLNCANLQAMMKARQQAPTPPLSQSTCKPIIFPQLQQHQPQKQSDSISTLHHMAAVRNPPQAPSSHPLLSSSTDVHINPMASMADSILMAAWHGSLKNIHPETPLVAMLDPNQTDQLWNPFTTEQ